MRKLLGLFILLLPLSGLTVFLCLEMGFKRGILTMVGASMATVLVTLSIVLGVRLLEPKEKTDNT